MLFLHGCFCSEGKQIKINKTAYYYYILIIYIIYIIYFANRSNDIGEGALAVSIWSASSEPPV